MRMALRAQHVVPDVLQSPALRIFPRGSIGNRMEARADDRHAARERFTQLVTELA